MKILNVLILSVIFSISAYSQSKKELDEKINLLEDKIKNLENDINNKLTQLQSKTTQFETDLTNVKTNLLNTTTTLGLVSKNNIDLEKIILEQKSILDNLVKKNDSLMNVIKSLNNNNTNNDFVVSPNSEEDSIVFALQSYLSCKKWEDRLMYVLHPEIIKPYMKIYYADGYKSRLVKKDGISIQGTNFKINEVFKVIWEDGTPFTSSQTSYFIKTPTGFKMDWMASTGFNPTSLKSFIVNSNNESKQFKVSAKISSDYMYNYAGYQNEYWCVYVSDEFGASIPYCYIAKNSKDGKKIYDILKDGYSHQFILELKMDNTMDQSGFVGVITKFIKEGWSVE